MFIIVGLTQVGLLVAMRVVPLRYLWRLGGLVSLLVVGLLWKLGAPLLFLFVALYLLLSTVYFGGEIGKLRGLRVGTLEGMLKIYEASHHKTRDIFARVKDINVLLEQNVLEVASLYELTREMNMSLEFADIFEIFSGALRRIFDFEKAKLILAHSSSQNEIDRIYEIRKVEGQHPVILSSERRRVTIIDRELRSHPNIVQAMNFDRQILRDLKKRKEAIMITQQIQHPATLKRKLPGDVQSFMAIPLLFEGQLLGALTMENFKEEVFEKFSILAGQLAMEVKKARLYEEIQELAIMDGLTGVFGRRHFLERYHEEFERSRRHKLRLAVLMLDLDHFKTYNDKYGHLVGDVALREIAAITKKTLREVDLVCRLGGEEFVVVLPETGKKGAIQVAERIRKAIHAHRIRAYDADTRMTVSIGVALYPTDADRPQGLIERADEALYLAKDIGRNRVIAYEKQA
jgi:diguanylate cyclase (GGDEF)-like protein